MDISKLVEDAKQGNTAAFAEIYEIYADRIFRYIRLKVQDKAQAEDILQEVFVKAWKGLKNTREEKLNFNAWIYKIAANTINDFFRKFYRSPQTLELNESIDVASSAGADQAVTVKQDSESLKQALSALPSQYRQVLDLRYIQDFSISETAYILGKSNLAVRLLLHRALKQLKKIFPKDV